MSEYCYVVLGNYSAKRGGYADLNVVQVKREDVSKVEEDYNSSAVFTCKAKALAQLARWKAESK